MLKNNNMGHGLGQKPAFMSQANDKKNEKKRN